MNWTTIVSLILGSSLLSALLTYALNLYVRSKDKLNYNSYAALILAHKLEDYSLECGDIVSDDKLLRDSGGAAGALAVSVPDSFELPQFEYKDFNHELLNDVLQFPKQVTSAHKHIQFELDLLSDDEASRTAVLKNTELGLAALDISKCLRSISRLPKSNPKLGKNDLRKFLCEQKEEAEPVA